MILIQNHRNRLFLLLPSHMFLQNQKNPVLLKMLRNKQNKNVRYTQNKNLSSKKHQKPIIKSDRIVKGMRDPISVHNRYNILEEERMDSSSYHSRSHSLSPTKTRTRIKFS
jgi:hypothetical protein